MRRRDPAAGGAPLCALARGDVARSQRRAAARLRRLCRGRLRRSRRPPGRDGDVRARLVHGRRRAARDRDHRPHQRRPRPPRARSQARVRMAHPVLGRPGADGPLRVPRHRGRRRLRRARAPRVHRAPLQPRRPAASGREGAHRELPHVPRAREPRVLPHLEREADQAGGVHALRPRPRELHRAPLGIRGRHLVLRRPRARPLRARDAGGVSRDPRPLDHPAPAHARPAPAVGRGVELGRLDQVLPPGRELPERDRQLLREGRPRRAVPRSPHPQSHCRPPLARRRHARAVAALRAGRDRRAGGRRRARRGGGERPQARHALRPLAARHRRAAARRDARDGRRGDGGAARRERVGSRRQAGLEAGQGAGVTRCARCPDRGRGQ